MTPPTEVLGRVEKLNPSHSSEAFACGQRSDICCLPRWLAHRRLLQPLCRRRRTRRGTRPLLKDALLRTVQAVNIAGIRALLVHAKDEDARRWYQALDFEPSPTDAHHLFLILKDLRAAIEG